jgi:hypothetical protein
MEVRDDGDVRHGFMSLICERMEDHMLQARQESTTTDDIRHDADRADQRESPVVTAYIIITADVSEQLGRDCGRRKGIAFGWVEITMYPEEYILECVTEICLRPLCVLVYVRSLSQFFTRITSRRRLLVSSSSPTSSRHPKPLRTGDTPSFRLLFWYSGRSGKHWIPLLFPLNIHTSSYIHSVASSYSFLLKATISHVPVASSQSHLLQPCTHHAHPKHVS